MKEKFLEIIKDKSNINSFLIAVLFSAPMISLIISIENIIPVIIVIVLALLLILNAKKISTNNKINIIPAVFLFVFAIIIIFNLVRLGLNRYFIDRIMYLIVFGILPCICVSIALNTEYKVYVIKIVRSMMLIYGVLSIFIYTTNFWAYTVGERMSITYYMLPLFICILIETFLDKNKNWKRYIVRYILYVIIFLPYIRFFISYSSRGALLAIFLCLILCLLWKKTLKQKIVILLIISLLVSVFLIFALDILRTFKGILDSFNISAPAINKSIRLIEEDKLDNGRDAIYDNALKGIFDHPITGNGIGQFDYNYQTYPHNILLQTWYEGGIFFLLLFIIPIVYSICNVMFNEKLETEDRFLLIFLISASIVRLMLSYEYWRDIFLWIFMYITIVTMSHNFEKRGVKDGKHNNTNIQEK